jgi:hypothetical protein
MNEKDFERITENQSMEEIALTVSREAHFARPIIERYLRLIGKKLLAENLRETSGFF